MKTCEELSTEISLTQYSHGTQTDCHAIHNHVLRLMDATTDLITAVPLNSPYRVSLKKLRYYYGEIMEHLESSHAILSSIEKDIEATQPDSAEDLEDSFDSFVDGCLTDLENWNGTMDYGSTVTFTVSEEGPNGTRYFSTTVSDGFVEATTREIPA